MFAIIVYYSKLSHSRSSNLLAFLLFALPIMAQHAPDVMWQTKAHDGPTLNVAITQNGLMIASISTNSVAKLWQLNNAAFVKSFETTGKAWILDGTKPPLAFSHDSKLLATTSFDGTRYEYVNIWNVDEASLIFSIVKFAPTTVEFTADDQFILVGAGMYPGSDLSLYGSANGSLKKTIIEGFSSSYMSISMAPNNDKIAACFGYNQDASAFVIIMTNSAILSPDGFNVQRCAYSSDGARIAFCGYFWDTHNNIPGQLLIMNPTNGVMERTFVGHVSSALDLAYSPDGKLLVSCGEDNTIRLWRTGGPCSIIKQKYFELVGTETVTRYRDIQVAEPLITYNIGTTGATCVAFAPDGKSFAYGQTNGNLTLARVPLWVTEAKKDGNQYVRAWQGGIGPYQVQQNETLNADSWQNVGEPTTATGCTNTITSKSTYFRVLDLRTQ